MSSYDPSMFPEFLPIGLIRRPYGGVKTEPPDVRAEEDLPRRFMFGCLQKGSFRKTESSWSASYRHPIREFRAEVAYDGILEVNFSWQGEKWMAISPGQTFTDIHLCIYPKGLDEAMKERLEQRYNLAYSIPNEKAGRDCCFPDGPPRCMVCPIRVSNLGTARNALQAMEKDEAIVAPLFACVVMGSSVVEYNLRLAPSYMLDPIFPILRPLSIAELPPAGEAERYKSEDGTEVLRVPRRRYFATFQTFFCDLERVAEWLHRFRLLGNAPDCLLDEELLDSIENRGFVCQGPESAGITVEYQENPIRQIAFNIQFDPAYLVSLTDSDAKIDELIRAVEQRSLALQIETNADRRKKE